MIAYDTAIRGAFFDIAQVADSADDIARHARYLPDGVLFIAEGHIQALLPWQEGEQYLDPHKGYSDQSGKLLLPGFIDAHVHYPQTEMIGAFGEQLLEWLTTYTFPVESQFSDEAYAKEIAEFFLGQLLSHGTTTALVFCTLHPESVNALFTEALRLNMRLIAGKVMMDRHTPDYLTETAEESYQQTRALIERWHQQGRLGYAITPRFAPTSTPELLSAVRQLRQAFPDTWLQTHLSENPNEVAWVKDLWPEHERYLDVYHHYGLTGERSLFAHGIHLEDREWQCLHENRFSGGLLPHLQPVPRQRPVPPARLLATPGADGYRNRRRRRYHLQYAAHAGGSVQGGPAAKLSSARQRSLLPRHPRRSARSASGREDRQLPTGQGS